MQIGQASPTEGRSSSAETSKNSNAIETIKSSQEVIEDEIIDAAHQEAYQNLSRLDNRQHRVVNTESPTYFETKKSQRLGTVLEKIAETTNSKDSRSKSEKSLE